MDDQNKKGSFDDFFANKPDHNSDRNDNEQTRASSQPHEQHHDDIDSQQGGDSSSNKSSYYYSYGPFKPGAQDGRYNSFRQQPESGEHPEDELPEDEQYDRGQVVTPQAAASETEQDPENVIVSSPQLRSLAPVAATRNGWQVKEKRKSPLRAVFIAFLAGVLSVGGLMYAADSNNWFTGKESLAASGTVQTGTNVSSDGSGAGVSNAADVVRPNNIAKIFEQASPAVVKVETYVKQQQRASNGGGMFDDPFFRQFFGDDTPNGGNGNDQQQNQSQGQLTPAGIGTGFFFDQSGYILTNQHVVADSDEIQVTVQGYDKPFTAKLLGSSYELDLAVLKVEGAKPFPTLALGSSDGINIGDWVIAIGNPYGFDHTVTIGVLSAKERPIDIPDENGTRQYKHLLQTDASINPGNSGGPLLNLKGEVVGINTAVSSQAQGIGFAIPTSTIQEVLESLKNNKEIPKAPVPFIGVELQNMTEEYAKQLGLSSTDGSLVRAVTFKSPAYLADVRQYDVITGADGTKYASYDKLVEAIQKHQVGDKIVLNVIRNGKNIDLTVEIGNRNDFNVEQQQQQQQQLQP
ncbi:HtrA2 peptidase [Paenibacillus curdlanolyticus YK9]|uniref:HtrA2 peptidase n=1 Tax=Paenibacillus curdlanolyticus YK9 TaxID=717606 RepID=E0IBF3_9BACL|nr:trypsin-like peptidase domain-containing protein [Paenibacillus curdlanolyticus]EFM10033.1 HtrA2 peptidase [Paenibacillus curdlanolyticus YK9]